MDTSQRDRSPFVFFSLVFALSVPLWLIGGSKLPLPVNLPVSALTAFVPAIAAAILVYRQSGRSGLRTLLRRAVDFRRVERRRWYVPVLLLAPLLYVISYLTMRLLGLPLPADIVIRWQALPAFFALYFVSGAGEEIGWTGYALDPIQRRHGAFKAGLLLGILWALWHAVTFVQTGNAQGWVLWQSLKTVATRLLLVWVYNNTGHSVFATILYHAADNTAWSLFPNTSSHYNPKVTGSLNWLVVCIIHIGWGTKAYTGRHRKST